MSAFKSQLERDIAAVFHNSEEFADLMDVEYNGKNYNIPVVIDSEIAKERVKAAGDNSVGIYAADITAFISFKDLKIVPRKETEIVIGGVAYNIVTVAFDAEEITLDLEMLDE
ncbi:MAG: hypothetical protein NC401_06645 [Ruminococcus sp.]|nr:hypothetical protein [Ruminococcus sp.]